MRVIVGNLLDVTEGVIAHQTNCIGVARVGVALSISTAYPEWEETYKAVCRAYTINNLLGKLHLYQATPTLTIASLFGQRVPSKPSNRRLMTDYEALQRALTMLRDRTPSDVSIYLPYGMGCGYGGGDWDVVQPLIETYCPGAILVRLR